MAGRTSDIEGGQTQRGVGGGDGWWTYNIHTRDTLGKGGDRHTK